MKRAYFFILFLCVPCVSKSMQVSFTTMIKFNGKKKTLYEWLRDDSNKAFGYTATFLMDKKNGNHYTKNGRVRDIKDWELDEIAKGEWFYCRDLKLKTINSKKIKMGAFVRLKLWNDMARIDNKGTWSQPVPITPELINLQTNLFYADYLKKSSEKKMRYLKNKNDPFDI